MNTKWTSMILLAGGLMGAVKTDVSQVTVCVDASNATSDFGFGRARSLAGKMFADAGVTIVWRPSDSCQADAIRISFTEDAPAAQYPGAMAYALPFEGTHIVVFYDRVQTTAGSRRRMPPFLAHVLVHEITHILQGIDRHAETGVMKAHWAEADVSEMVFKPLAFTKLDVFLIHQGLATRQNGLAARREIASKGQPSHQ